METHQLALWQEDFLQLQELTLPSPPLPLLQVSTHSRLSSPMPVSPTPPSQPLPQPCLPQGTLLMTPELLHGFVMESSVCGHCFHTDLGGCSRHVSGEQDHRPGGETAYGEDASSRDHSPAKAGASCSSSSTSAPFGN